MKLAILALAVIGLAGMGLKAQGPQSSSVPLSELTEDTQSSVALVGGLAGTAILTCKSSPDGFTMTGCEIAEGHTLDEAMTAIYMSMGESSRAYAREEDGLRGVIGLQQKMIDLYKKQVSDLTKALKADQKAFRKMEDLFSPKGGPHT